MSTVLCLGTFDLLHPGHEDYFRQAHALGDRVAVVVARDATVLAVKGQLPAMNEQERLEKVAAHPLVDEARLGYPGDKYRVVEEIKPDLILLGYDQQAFTDGLGDEMIKRGLQVEIQRAVPFEPHRWKSSLLRQELAFADGADEDALPL